MIIKINGEFIIGGATDFDGKFEMKLTVDSVVSNVIDIEISYVGYEQLIVKSIPLKDSSIINIDPKLTMLKDLSFITGAITIIQYDPPLFTKDPSPSGKTYKSDDLKHKPGR